MADDTLQISFQNEKPLPVGELGKLLEDLGGDYHRVTGSHLVLSNVITGSTLLILQDVITTVGSGAETVSAVLAAAENLHSFSKRLKDYLKSSKTPPILSDAYKHPSPVMKTGERLAKISIEQKTPFGLKYHRDDKGESIEFNYNPSEAAEIRENIKLERMMRKEALTTSRLRIAGPAPQYRLEGPSTNAQDAQSFRVPALGADQSEAAVLIWVNVLKDNGLEWFLPKLADDFEGQGNYEVARIIRTQISGDDKGTVSVTE
ncbi:hypothetical protein [Mesorhizobium sp. M0955]|uniref:hypothetical protein n=1 Tax=unclassified Mesorhizobium TaxID=325217 RepID=UPI00333A84E7